MSNRSEFPTQRQSVRSMDDSPNPDGGTVQRFTRAARRILDWSTLRVDFERDGHEYGWSLGVQWPPLQTYGYGTHADYVAPWRYDHGLMLARHQIHQVWEEGLGANGALIAEEAMDPEDTWLMGQLLMLGDRSGDTSRE